MKLNEAVRALAALAQPSRLQVFRFLVQSGKPRSAGEIAGKVGIAKPTLSFHLKELSHAGLLESERDGRSIYYQVRIEGMRGLMAYLTEDCCQGRPELCLPPVAETCCGTAPSI